MATAAASFTPQLRRMAQYTSRRHFARATPKSGEKTGLVPSNPQEVGPADGGWAPVKDSKSGGIYFWNKHTNETTAVGEPRPGPEGRVVTNVQNTGGMIGYVGSLVGLGAGVAIASVVVRSVLG